MLARAPPPSSASGVFQTRPARGAVGDKYVPARLTLSQHDLEWWLPAA